METIRKKYKKNVKILREKTTKMKNNAAIYSI